VGFKVGQKVVYPNHGIGTIEQIEQKQIGAVALPFYTLRLAATNSLVLVPVCNASEVGLRRPITSGECDVLFKALASDFSTPANDWKDRFKEFSEKMRTGNIFEVADVLKHLSYLSQVSRCRSANSGCSSDRGIWSSLNWRPFAISRNATSNPVSIRHCCRPAPGTSASQPATARPASQPRRPGPIKNRSESINFAFLKAADIISPDGRPRFGRAPCYDTASLFAIRNG